MFLVMACSNETDNHENDQAASEGNSSAENDAEIEEENEEKDDVENSSSDIEEEDDEPTSEFTITETSISSFFVKTSTEIGSEFDKEVMETLSEFNATNTGDGAKLTLPEDILFDFDSATLLSEADDAIEQLVQVIEATEDGDDVSITGHTDSKGEDDYNQALSEDRANEVLDALADEGVDGSRLNAEGKGAEDPVASNTHSDGSDNPKGRQKNRRVEVIIHGVNQ